MLNPFIKMSYALYLELYLWLAKLFMVNNSYLDEISLSANNLFQ